jgi:hypothetical protein
MSENPADTPKNGAPATEAAVDDLVGRIEGGTEDARSKIHAVLSGSAFEGDIEDLKFCQLLRAGDRVPDFDQILQVFTPAMLAKASAFAGPELALNVKGVSPDDMISAIDGHKTMRFQRKTLVDDIYKGEISAKRAENWSAHIVETGRAHFEENPFFPLERRLGLFDEYKTANGVGGMDLQMFLSVIMRRLRKGNPGAFHVMIDAEPALGGHIPVASWDPNWWNRRILLEKRETTDARDSDILLCRSVGGVVRI